MSAGDSRFMRLALEMARRGLGMSWPNPSVGCVLVKHGEILAATHTAPGGRPHAETQALAEIGSNAIGATAYVTLEPCAHHGQTPPCASALIAAGITRVVCAVQDSDSRVAGRGFAMLRAAGIEVVTGVCAAEATEILKGFFHRIAHQRPFITAKIATAFDGNIALGNGQSQWISGAMARNYVQLLRHEHDAVMTGIGTVLADDSRLTVRIPGLESRRNTRILLDSQLRIPPMSHLLQSAPHHPLLILTTAPETPDYLSNATLHRCAADAHDRIDLPNAMTALGSLGYTSILLEAGAKLLGACLQHGLIDRLVWVHSPKMIGSDGIPALPALGLTMMAAVTAWKPLAHQSLNDDMVTILCPPPHLHP